MPPISRWRGDLCFLGKNACRKSYLRLRLDSVEMAVLTQLNISNRRLTWIYDVPASCRTTLDCSRTSLDMRHLGCGHTTRDTACACRSTWAKVCGCRRDSEYVRKQAGEQQRHHSQMLRRHVNHSTRQQGIFAAAYDSMDVQWNCRQSRT
jgi:hypothetical protein